MLYTISLVFDVVFHDSLFAYNTQGSMQYVPSLIPITSLSQSPPLPSEALSLFPRVHSLPWFIPPSFYPTLHSSLPSPTDLPAISHVP